MTLISFKIHHYQRCSKSRKALEILSAKTKNYKIIKYLEHGIDIVEIKSILKSNKISTDEIIRINDSFYKELKLPKKGLSKDEIIEYIVKFPILLQRPLISKYLDNKLVQTIIGRPPEKVLSLFD